MSRPGVIVPAYRAARIVGTTGPAFRAQTVPADWVFVDDGSDDGTASALEATLAGPWACPESSARVLRLSRNSGRAAARNAGIAALASTSDPVVFLDVDVEPPPTLLASFQHALRDAAAAAVVARIQPASPDPENPYHRYLASSLRGPRRGGGPVPWRFFLTTAAAVRRSALDAVGGFDRTVTYGEDLDLAVRLSHHAPDGLRVADAAPVKMHEAGDLASALAKVTEFGRRNLPAMVARHPELAVWTRAAWLAGRDGSLTGRLAHALLHPRVGRWVRQRIASVPAGVSNVAVRYALASRFAEAYREGVDRHAPGLSVDLTDVSDASMRAAEWVEAILQRSGASSELSGRAVLALSEAVANAVEHGAPPLSVRAAPDAGLLRLEVREGGEGPDPHHLAHARLPADPLATHGRGLYLIRTLADEVDIRPGVVTLSFRPRRA